MESGKQYQKSWLAFAKHYIIDHKDITMFDIVHSNVDFGWNTSQHTLETYNLIEKVPIHTFKKLEP